MCAMIGTLVLTSIKFMGVSKGAVGVCIAEDSPKSPKTRTTVIFENGNHCEMDNEELNTFTKYLGQRKMFYILQDNSKLAADFATGVFTPAFKEARKLKRIKSTR